ncbi:hypothetical protein SADUNF_Sadunf09G0043400 [Salix dunnii]|uniref:Methyltransferase type 11 domain-containing protein n=1 Tax=Salix dunnii TaxID=1413687 RepID=A0A835MW09_9ROSI|nr:hypothetical protein SADUNF_Sadunf09G0043400 [Salix dunnii]
MYRDVSSFNTYNYGDALYWDARYIQEAKSFDWYQHYSSLRPIVRRYIPTSSRVLMVGCGNALMSEDMVEDGYENIMNIDISSVAIDIMRRKYEHVHQLNYMEMDARDMSFFPDKSFDAAVDKGILLSLHLDLLFNVGTLDSLMCGSDDHISSVRMLREITYGDPKVRMPHLTQSIYKWKIVLYIIPRPGFEKPGGSSSNSHLEPVPISDTGLLPADFVLEDPDSKKMDETTEVSDLSSYPLIADAL